MKKTINIITLVIVTEIAYAVFSIQQKIRGVSNSIFSN
jgi:hypothetical protein